MVRLIPGSNDGLILVGMPLLWPYAWLAIATMCLAIWAAMAIEGIRSGRPVAWLGALLASLLTWHRILGSIDIRSVNRPLPEFFYWMTIMFSQTLGTALGDWTADTAGMGYLGAALIFSAMLLVVLLLAMRAVRNTAAST